MSLCLADTHAHLADPALLPNVAAVVAAAANAGVERILAVGTDLATSRACVALSDEFPGGYSAVGIHPTEASQFDSSSIDELRRLAEHPKVVAIGEIGLDYVRDLTPPTAQQQAFAAQLALAAELGLPVVVHNREADADIMRHIPEVSRPAALARRAGVLHCYTGSAAMAEQAWQHGFRVSFAGNLTYRRSTELRAVAASLADEWVLVETDSPYLAPEPRRGRTNVPENVLYVARQLAELRGVSLEEEANQTSQNARELFGWT